MVKYTFLAEFDLLRFSQDIRQHLWSQPAICDTVVKHFKLHCAQAEIARLNVELPRLTTAIRDEGHTILAHLHRLEATTSGAALAHEGHFQWSLCQAVNEKHLDQI